jgi:hypothetical protein
MDRLGGPSARPSLIGRRLLAATFAPDGDIKRPAGLNRRVFS